MFCMSLYYPPTGFLIGGYHCPTIGTAENSFSYIFSHQLNSLSKICKMNKEIPVCKILIVICKIVVMCVHINPTCKKPQTECYAYNTKQSSKTVLYIQFSFSFHNIKTFQVIFSRSLTVYIL